MFVQEEPYKQLELIKCTQCGVCCFESLCPVGELDSNTGFCKYLEVYRFKTSCRLVKNGVGEEMSIGTGCVLKHFPRTYEKYKQEFEQKKRSLKI